MTGFANRQRLGSVCSGFGIGFLREETASHNEALRNA
jgi:hypothetical protein